MFRIKRAYAPPRPEDGTRVLVDRLWPRGLAKDAAAVDLWLKEVAPSKELRQWFGHDPARWKSFSAKYLKELKAPERAAAALETTGWPAEQCDADSFDTALTSGKLHITDDAEALIAALLPVGCVLLL